MSNKEVKTYEITIIGCDDQTYFEADLNKQEFEILNKIELKSKEVSTYDCMPIIEIKLKK